MLRETQCWTFGWGLKREGTVPSGVFVAGALWKWIAGIFFGNQNKRAIFHKVLGFHMGPNKSMLTTQNDPAISI
jgi:hypothetical protein